eukprot:364818-Chlamydomonas_euryale.AAC.12
MACQRVNGPPLCLCHPPWALRPLETMFVNVCRRAEAAEVCLCKACSWLHYVGCVLLGSPAAVSSAWIHSTGSRCWCNSIPYISNQASAKFCNPPPCQCLAARGAAASMPNQASVELNSSDLSRANSLMDSQYLDAGCATASGNRYGNLNQVQSRAYRQGLSSMFALFAVCSHVAAPEPEWHAAPPVPTPHAPCPCPCRTTASSRKCTLQQKYQWMGSRPTWQRFAMATTCLLLAFVLAWQAGHALLGDKAAIFAGKAMIRALYAGTFRNKKLARVAADDCQDEMRRIFSKGHAAALSVYESAPLSIKYPSHIPGGKLLDFSLVDLPGGVQVYRCNGRGPEKMFEFGTTATVAVLQGRRLCLGNVGDSAAVLGSWDTARSCYTGEIVTRQHWGLDKEEAARINEGFSSLTKVLDDGYIKALDGPLLGYELSVTRALGHRGLAKHGVLAEPHVVVRDMEDSHCCVVVASDGVWDVMAADDVVMHVMASSARGLHGQAAAAALVAYAVQLGTTSPSGQQDNTSAAVLFV